VKDPHWVEYVGAFGGIAAAATAVGIATWTARRDRRQRPRLELLYDDRHTDDFAAGLNDDSQHWVRLRVFNAPGRRSAEDVEVVVVQFEEEEADRLDPMLLTGERTRRGVLTGFALTWSNTFDNSGLHATRIAIPPGVYRRVDLLSVHQPVGSDGGGGSVPMPEGSEARAMLRSIPAQQATQA
jgi:hypothetical protein